MQQSVKERIMIYIKKTGISIKSFERQAGLANGYVNHLRRSPTTEKVENIIRAFPDLNREWLLTGEGEMLNQETAKSTDQKPEEGGNLPANGNSEGDKPLNNPKSYGLDLEEEVRQLRSEVERLKELLQVKNDEIFFYRSAISSALKGSNDEK